MIRVLIVEDSVTQREIFRRLLTSDDQFTVVGEASDGREALAKVKELLPDCVLMDIHMPGWDGIKATREIMAECPVPIVIASATLRNADVDWAMKALEEGAVSVIEKPAGAVLLHLRKLAPALRRELVAASRSKARLSRTNPSAPAQRPTQPPTKLPTQPPMAAGVSGTLQNLTERPFPRVKVIGICASTGGPTALLQVLSAMSKPVSVPILLVQHISHGFEEGFARWLSTSSGQQVQLATPGQKLEPGVWMASGLRHLVLGSAARLELVPGSPEEIHCPSGNPLFESLATHLGASAAGVIMTGMGDDGATGLLALKNAGGVTLAQDEASSLIYGMPRVARERGAVRYALSPAGIARALQQMTDEGSPTCATFS